MSTSTHIRSGLGALAFASLCAGATAPLAAPAAAPVPIQAFFSPPSMSHLSLSPNGEYFAMLVRVSTGRRQLVVGPFSAPTESRAVAGFTDADVVHAEWVDDQHLIYSSGEDNESAENSRRSAMFIVGRDGSDARQLIRIDRRKDETSSRIVKHVLDSSHFLERTLRDGTSDILVDRAILGRGTAYDGYLLQRVEAIVPLRVDTTTLSTRELVPKELIGRGKDFLFDERGRLRLATLADGDTTTLLLAPDDTTRPVSEWRTVWSGPRYGAAPGVVHPIAVAPDGTVYVERSTDDGTAVYALDKEGRVAAAPIVSIKGFDFRGDLVFNRRTGKLAGVHYESDAAGAAWLDPTVAAVQAKLDAKLQGLANHVEPADCGCSSHYAVTSTSDHQPAIYMLYDAEKDTLVQLGQQRPDISARDMSDTDFYRFKARDGLEIPAYVTHPKGKGPWPTVVLVHGGPWVRGATWEWSGTRQFLASRGYLVVEPEFRGSEGYGSRLFLAGLKQWGLAMQDDVADATKWAAEKGWADPKRVCLMGGSYGGYSTLMGLARDGDLYRCGVAYAAPSDLIGMYDMWWSDASDDWRGAGLPMMMGDKVKDADLLRAASPVFQAKRIDKPLLLAHGGLDLRVPPEHAERLRDALKAAGHPPTWVNYSDEGHGWKKPENRYDFFRRVEAFLAENLK